MALYLVITSK